jgi:subtilisin family serine protease
VINLSLVVDVSPSIATERWLRDVLDAAARQGVLVVAATANSYLPTYSPLLAHPWVLSIVASDAWGKLAPLSQLTPAVRRRALSAPGLGLSTVVPAGGPTVMSGTSAATAVVTATAVLLRSLFPHMNGDQIRWAPYTRSTRTHGPPVPLVNLMHGQPLSTSLNSESTHKHTTDALLEGGPGDAGTGIPYASTSSAPGLRDGR